MTENTSLFDLILAFFRWIKHLCIAAWHGCGKCVRLSWRMWYITVPMLCIGLGLGYVGSSFPYRFYRVEGMAILNGTTPELVANRYNDLNKMFPSTLLPTQGKTDLLHWNGAEQDCFKFMKFQSYQVVDYLRDSIPDQVDFSGSFDATDTLHMRMQNRLYLRFVTRDLPNVAQAEQAILRYLNSDPQLIAAYESHKANLEWESQFCERQVNLLDSFTTDYLFHQGTDAHFRPNQYQMLIGNRDIRLLHDDILLLLEHKKFVDRELALCTAPVVMQSGFMVSPRAINRRSNTILISLCVFYLLSLAVSALVEQRKTIHAWLKK